MNKKLFGFFLIFCGLILLIGITYIIFFHNFNPEEAAPQTVVNGNATTSQGQIPEQNNGGLSENKPITIDDFSSGAETAKEPKDKIVMEKSEIERVSSLFTERYGSFSTQSDFGNITDLYYFMTDEMKKREEESVAKLRRREADPEGFYGVITKAVSSQISDHQAGARASVSVHTKRQEADGGNNTGYYQTANLKLIMDGGSWKVDQFSWGKAEAAGR